MITPAVLVAKADTAPMPFLIPVSRCTRPVIPRKRSVITLSAQPFRHAS